MNENPALKLAELVGELCAVVNWCVGHDGECLADNPHQLAIARRVLEKARAPLANESESSL